MSLSWRSIAILACVAIALMAMRAVDPKPVEELRALGFDLFQGVSPALDEETAFAVVRIGEESVEKMGPWPWRRDKVAAIVERLHVLGASAVVVNLLLDAPDRFSAPSLLQEATPAADAERLQQLRAAFEELPDPDVVLARSLRSIPAALATSVVVTSAPDQPLQAPPLAIPLNATLVRDMPDFEGVIAAIPTLREAAAAEGAINLLPEHDMVLRRAPLFFLVGDVVHPTLPVAALIAAGRDVAIERGPGGRTGLAVDGAVRASDGAGVVWLDFGRVDRIPVLEAAALDDAAQAVIAGRIVVLGLDAVGLSSRWRLADGHLVSGSEVVATIADALDVGSSLSRSMAAEIIEVALMLAAALLIAAAWLQLAPRLALAITLALAVLWLGTVFLARSQAGIILDAVSPIAFWGMLAAAALTVRTAALWRARGELIAALETRTAAAEAANQAKTRFLKEMYHDIRTPLNAIIGFSSVIATRPKAFFTAEKGAEFGKAMTTAGELILSLSERALQAAEMSTENAQPEPEDIKVNDLLADAAGIMRGNRRRTAELEMRSEEPSPVVHVDRTYFLEAVLNLLENAFRHAVGTETVVLSAGRTGPAMVAVDVIDDGPGISEELLERVGTPFIPGRSEQHGMRSPGLGLYIVKRFADMHGGRLELMNRPEGGLRARIELPLQQHQSAPGPHDATSQGHEAQN